jgi:peptide deformylase
MLIIEKYKSPILYKTARPVREDEFGESLDSFMSEMATTMYASSGVGLAGPQVGSDLRVLVADMAYLDYRDYGSELIKVVNPVIIWTSDNVAKAMEQCLSYPDLEVAVDRSEELILSYQTPLGDRREASYKGWQSRVLLHEIDHLNGVTLYTKASVVVRKRYQKSIPN